ncbi:hypothetical protein ACSDR0_16540 [Streptosporangium sp. G11]|uniref:hypothetical protein n=1 Tax=Streptosporangium sp. G11 TaxID=3436926 RepID=UPI003EBBAB68
MFEVGVIEEAGAAGAGLAPIRARPLTPPVEPRSVTSLAATTGPPRALGHRTADRRGRHDTKES